MSDLILTPDSNPALLSDIRRAITNKAYELAENGALVLKDAKLAIGGIFHSGVKRHELVQKAIDSGDLDKVAWARQKIFELGDTLTGAGYFRIPELASSDHNLVPDGGLNFVLNLLFRSTQAKVTTWYHGVFIENATPSATWLSNWAADATGPLGVELPQARFTESGGRQAAVFATDAASETITASTETTFTFASGSPETAAYGSTLQNVQTIKYAGTDKILLAATTFGTPKQGLTAGDKLAVLYEMTGSST